MIFLGDPRALVAAEFLDQVVQHFAEAGWPVKRVLTDWGSEFKGAFDQACKNRRIKHTRTKPRHAFTNGFVERLQGTILHEHWRIEFRRRYFTKLSQLDRSIQSYLRLYRSIAAIARVEEHRLRSSGEPAMNELEMSRPLRHRTR